ncbi:LacI family DNA-binding transcriptional regulator [Streptomyces sp. NPDC004288]
MVTMQDVARRAGVTKQTVSNVVTGRVGVRPDTAARVRVAIDELGYVPNLVARSLATGSTRTVGLFVPTVGTAFYADLVEEVEDALDEHGHHLLLCTTRRSGDRARRHLAGLTSRSVDALLVAGDQDLLDHLPLLADARFPVALCAWETDAPPRFPMVTVDYEKGGLLAGRHLRDLGHEHVVVLASPAHARRVEGFKRAFTERGREVREDRVHFVHEPSFRAAFDAARFALAAYPEVTALFATHDVLATGAVEAAQAANRTVPFDLSVVAYDDCPAGPSFRPSMTSVVLPRRQMARSAVSLLLDAAAGREPATPHRMLPPELVVRDSSGPAAKREGGSGAG